MTTARRTEICRAAAHTFVERGYDATSVNDVAAALGITKAGLYHYIQSKESLLFDIIMLGLDALEQEVVEPTRAERDPVARFRAIVRRHALLSTCSDGVVTLLVEEVHALPRALRRKVNARRRRHFEYVRDTLKAVKQRGQLADVDVRVAAFAVLGMILWLPQWFRPGGRLSSEQVAEEIVALASAGLIVAPRSRKPRAASRSVARRSSATRRARALQSRPFVQSDPRRFEICMTAARTFVERGFEATSVNEIASALGVTKAGLYHYISSKDALFFEILSMGMDWLDAEVIKPVQPIADTEERFRETVKRHARLSACNEPWITELLDEMHALRTTERRKIELRKRGYFDMVRGMIRELKARRRTSDLDPTVATFALFGMLIWIPRWLKPDGPLTPERVADDIATIGLGAVLSPR